MFVYEFHCDRCRSRVVAAMGVIGYYQTPEGTRSPALSSPAWCNRCSTVVDAEALPDMSRLAAELHRLQTEGPNNSDRTLAEEFGDNCADFCLRRIKRWTEMLDLFGSRVSPNRCIECGASDFQVLRSAEGGMPAEFDHPQCMGRFELTQICHASQATYFVLDLEGNRL
jgi:hypothetical protein